MNRGQLLLKEWMIKNKLSNEQAASFLDVNYFMLSKLLNGHACPSVDVAYRIKEKTNEQVTIESWLQEAKI